MRTPTIATAVLAATFYAGCAPTNLELESNQADQSSHVAKKKRDKRIVICPDILPSDGRTVLGLSLDGETLVVPVEYTGGCRDHDFTLCWDGGFLESYPVQVNLRLGHDAHDDPCEARIAEDLRFNLRRLKRAYQRAYQTDEGTIILHLDDHSTTFTFPEPDPGDDDEVGEIGLCPEELADDPVFLRGMAVDRPNLTVNIEYSGGCEEHTFLLCWTGNFLESYPVQTQLRLGHDAHGDMCEAAILEELTVDLTPVEMAYRKIYQTDSGTIILRLGDLRGDYVF